MSVVFLDVTDRPLEVVAHRANLMLHPTVITSNRNFIRP